MNLSSIKRLQELPLLEDAPKSVIADLLTRKLVLCSTVYDFEYENQQRIEKEAKTDTLVEMVEYISSGKLEFTKPIINSIMSMVVANICRPLDKKRLKKVAKGEDEEDISFTLEWPHLELVYDILFKVASCKDLDSKTIKEYFTKNFMVRFLNLFHSEDPREREVLKTILHRVYGKYMSLRSFIRRTINDMFYTFVYEGGTLHGVPELLEILGSIINGFALPLKDEHVQFLEKTLLPLHKVPKLAPFHQPLSYCIVQFVSKDPNTAIGIIYGLLRLWPITDSVKEILFLSEVEELLELIQEDQFSKVAKPLFTKIGECMRTPQFQVAQRALYIWNNEHVVHLVTMYRVDIFPLVFAALYFNTESHWNPNIKTLSYNVLKLLLEIDLQLFDQCASAIQHMDKRKEVDTARRNKLWRLVSISSKSIEI